MKTNRKPATIEAPTMTYNGAPAVLEKPEKELLRAVSACMLFENTYYEKGSDIADRIESLSKKVSLQFLSDLAKKTRKELMLRHVSLFLLVQMCKHPETKNRRIIGETITDVISRADELAETVALYWKGGGGKRPLPAQMKLGVAEAFHKFDEYALGKYNQKNEVKLRDVMFLTHPRPKNKTEEKLWKKLAEDELKTPDTWEAQLSGGADKKETFTRLIKEEKLGYMALIRNLRNMAEAGVDSKIVNKALLEGAKKSKALPFRFVSAAKYAPAYARALSDAMLSAIEDHPKMEGTTAVVVDVSGSMDQTLSEKSEMSRLDAASALAVYMSEIGQARVFTFSDNLMEVPAYRGLALTEGISKSQNHGSTYLGSAIESLLTKINQKFDRIIVITDEQSNDEVPALSKGTKGYIINVATYQPALPTGRNGWTRISGFSERVVDWMMAEERED